MAKEKNYTNIVLIVLLVAAAFLLGKMWDKSKITGSGSTVPTGGVSPAAKDPDAVLAGYAGQIGLDVDQFKSCVSSGKYAQAVKDNLAFSNEIAKTAWDLNVIDHKEIPSRDQAGFGTPTFFINGRILVGAQPYEVFDTAIKEALNGQAKGPALKQDTLDQIVANAAAVKGDKEMKVVVAEFSDYECPFCGRYVTQTMPEILKNYGDKILYVFLDYPLPFHQSAQKMAEAARCAGEQGKYWELHDLIYAGQADWSG
ncbi:MAG: thioredoxin domain-containing protein [Candidatus Shapirobacteria bacterium]